MGRDGELCWEDEYAWAWTVNREPALLKLVLLIMCNFQESAKGEA